MGESRRHTLRGVIAVACLAAFALVLFVLINQSGSYKVVAQFENAGQLVEGGVVEVAGRQVGSITAIGVGDDGTAEVEFEVSDDRFVPLERGTRATIRAVGQAGITNRYLDLTPSPTGGEEIKDGGTLGLTETSGIVDLDALFSTFDPKTRDDIGELASRSAEVFAGSGSAWFNGVLAQISPAFEQFSRVGADLNSDQAQLDRLIVSGGETAAALSADRGALSGAISHTAGVLAEVDSARTELADDIERLPGVLSQATGTLATLRGIMPAVRSDLERIPAAARPLGDVLSRVRPAARNLRPVIGDLRAALPDLEASLLGLKPLKKVANPALRNLGEGLKEAIPALAAVRVYTPDLILGVIGGFAALSASRYDSLGKYGRLIVTEGPETVPFGYGRLFPAPSLPGFKLKTGLTAPCPGAAARPAPDASNVWVPDPDLCNPEHTLYTGE